MLKLSGWSCLNSGRNEREERGSDPPLLCGCEHAVNKPSHSMGMYPAKGTYQSSGLCISKAAHRLFCSRPAVASGTARSILFPGESDEMGQPTLRQACPRPKPRAQYAFKNSMIRGILQFTLSIAFRCVLHRCGSQDIRC